MTSLLRLIATTISIITMLLSGCISVSAEKLTILTVKDLSEPVESLKTSFEETYSAHQATIIYTIRPNINTFTDKNAPIADVIIIDNYPLLLSLKEKGLIHHETIKKLSRDNLCVIKARSSHMRPFFLYPRIPVPKAVIISSPRDTYLGYYTEQTLKKLNRWTSLSTKLLLVQSSQEVIKMVSKGLYDGGIAYCSTAWKSNVIEVTDTLSPQTHEPIIIASGASKYSRSQEAIKDFTAFLDSSTAKAILKKYNLSL